jgi:hypothetical protein
MKIGLVDVDGHNYPNIALMKISAHEKQNGNQVEWCVPMMKYDRVYAAKVFTFTPDFDTCVDTKEMIFGGTGYDLENKLPDAIENTYPDYTIYPQFKEAYGFLTRGCPRNCPFCGVGKKEGLISNKVADLSSFWKGQKEIKLCDPNILACKNSVELLDQLIESKTWIDINQGLDIRFMTEEFTEKIMRLKLKMLHFAWDGEKDSELILNNLEQFKKVTKIDYRKLNVYVLTNYNTTFEFDLYRIYKLKELGYNPYVMIYNKEHASDNVRHLQRWVNNKIIFRTCEKFEEYNSKLA